ncbi:MAG: cytochrome c biogenesis CcdA family protein [Thermotogota bacterium]
MDLNLTLISVDFLSAFTGGILAFFSPCVLPLIPLYLGILFIDIQNPKQVFKRSIGFFIGLSLFFSLLGILSGSLSVIFINYQKEINILTGLLVIVFGGLYLLNKSLNLKIKMNLNKYKDDSFFSAIILGIMIALVWVPCSGPVLGAIMSMAASKTNVLQSGLLLFIYSLGISLPFIFIGSTVSRLMKKVVIGEPRWLKYLRVIGGILIILIGILIFFGKFNDLQGVIT